MLQISNQTCSQKNTPVTRQGSSNRKLIKIIKEYKHGPSIPPINLKV